MQDLTLLAVSAAFFLAGWGAKSIQVELWRRSRE